MWISKHKWEAMERRVEYLESRTFKEPEMYAEDTGHLNLWYYRPKTFPVSLVVKAILDHLGLRMEAIRATPETLSLVKRGGEAGK